MRATSTAPARSLADRDNLPADSRASITHGDRRFFAKSATIFAEGEQASFIYKVVSGTVQTSRLLSDGRRQIDSFLFAGDIFGLQSAEEHSCSAEVLEDAELLVFRRCCFRTMSQQRPALADELMTGAVAGLDRARNHVLLLATKSARERLVIFLLDIARRLRADRFSLPMPRTGIADHLGMTRETVSRTLSGLSREGLIRLESTDRVLLRDRTGLKRVMLEEKV